MFLDVRTVVTTEYIFGNKTAINVASMFPVINYLSLLISWGVMIKVMSFIAKNAINLLTMRNTDFKYKCKLWSYKLLYIRKWYAWIFGRKWSI